jgi:uncharacterized protein (TIGR00730 family)
MPLHPARVTVFCGSAGGNDPAYAAAATCFGRELVARRLALVYGGGRSGMMGTLADAVLESGGSVIGVIPDFLVQAEHAHPGVSRMHVVSSMHERKATMATLAGAFVALPGGLGTFEELLEVLTWSQLGIHPRPVGVLDVAGYFRPLVALLDHACGAGFLSRRDRARLIVASAAGDLLDRLQAAEPPPAATPLERA